MKRTAFILAFIFISSSMAFAQKRSELTGPAYKNYKPWQDDSKPAPVYSVAKKEQLQGPAYKNQKAWEKKASKATYTTVSFGSERSKLTGPAYKNYKPWRKNDKNDSSANSGAKNDSTI